MLFRSVLAEPRPGLELWLRPHGSQDRVCLLGVFYQTPQKEHVYQQKNKLLMEVYGFNDSFSASDAAHDLAPPPALPPKQRQLVSGGPPTSGPGCWACSPARISPRRSGCSSRAGPCSWDWLVLRMFAFFVDSLFFFSLSFVALI